MADGEAAKDIGSSASDEEASNVPLTDDFNSIFRCFVCLDLPYKPIILACGHLSCFWCVHKAMHHWRASHCAICRRPYMHFPSICELLHFLFLKLEPVAYKRREMEVSEEEKNSNRYSPQILDHPEIEKFCFGEETSTESIKERRHSGDFKHSENNSKRKISEDDVRCSLCKEMLYQPAALNCGHVYCEPCLCGLSGDPLQCQVCQSPHPGDLPTVCLDLDHFLEEEFPREYAMRKEVQLKKASCQITNPSPSFVQTQKPKEKLACTDMDLWHSEEVSDVHVGVGCDSCGVYPIVGKRYKCKDCKEEIGFDLCEACYNTTSKLPGRFNQQHTPEHRFELDDSRKLRNILSVTPELGHQLVFVPDDDEPSDYSEYEDGDDEENV